MVRLEEYKEADESELSEPEWCWCSSCVENYVNGVSMQDTFAQKMKKTKGARTWHLVNLPEQDAELELFLWFKNNKTLPVSCVLFPIQSR